jgi:hypothetical protein
MADPTNKNLSDQEMFLKKGTEFFSWYTHEQSPVFQSKASVIRLRDAVDGLDKTMDEAKTIAEAGSKASTVLSKTLNRLTLAGVLVGTGNIVVQVIGLFVRH